LYRHRFKTITDIPKIVAKDRDFEQKFDDVKTRFEYFVGFSFDAEVKKRLEAGFFEV
jgi:uncharacterized protein YutD